MDSSPSTGPESEPAARDHLVRMVRQALAAVQDSVVELGREDGFLSGYHDLHRLEIIPPEAVAQLPLLGMFNVNPPLVDCLGVFADVGIVDDSILIRNDAPVVENNFVPAYIHSIYETHPTYKAAIATHNARTTIKISGAVFVPLHPWCKIYGHFLLESLPRLAVIKYLWELGFTYPVYIDGKSSKFLFDYLALALPGVTIIKGEPGNIYCPDRVLIPNLDHPLARLTTLRRRFVDDLVASCRMPAGAHRPAWRKIFIRRPTLPGQNYRYLANQDALSALAARHGFETVSPEKFSVAEQIRLFSESLCVAGEFSSALHNAIFSPAESTVISFNWVNNYQLSIALAKKQQLIVLAPEQGAFIGARSSVSTAYTIAEAVFEAVLQKQYPPVPEDGARGRLAWLRAWLRRWRPGRGRR